MNKYIRIPAESLLYDDKRKTDLLEHAFLAYAPPTMATETATETVAILKAFVTALDKALLTEALERADPLTIDLDEDAVGILLPDELRDSTLFALSVAIEMSIDALISDNGTLNQKMMEAHRDNPAY